MLKLPDDQSLRSRRRRSVIATHIGEEIKEETKQPSTPRPRVLGKRNFLALQPTIPLSKDDVSFFTLFFLNDKIEDAYSHYHKGHFSNSLRFSFLAAFGVTCSTLLIFTDKYSSSSAITLVTLSALQFLVGLGFTFNDQFNIKTLHNMLFMMLMASFTFIVYSVGLMVEEHPNSPSAQFAVHPFGYLVIMMSFIAIIAFSKMRFLNCFAFSAYSYLTYFVVRTNSDLLQWSDPQLSRILHLYVLCSVSILSLYGYFTELKRRTEFFQMHKLNVKNIELQAQVDALRSTSKSNLLDGKLDLTSPIEQITDVLSNIVQDPNISDINLKNLEKVIDLLTQEKIYSPDIESRISRGRIQVDTETESWLLTEVSSRKISRNFSQPTLLTKRSSLQDFSMELPKYDSFFETVLEWDFDIFGFGKAAGKKSLKSLAFKIIEKHNLIEELKLDAPKLLKLLSKIESKYRDLPYHNNLHAADVVQSVNCLLSSPALINKTTPLEKLAVIIAAAVHDLDHYGVGNSFLIKTRDNLAVLYNDQSPLENHHLATAFGIIYTEECNILSEMSTEDQTSFRKIVIDLVLATDITKHFSLIANFNSKVNVGNLDIAKADDMSLLLQMLMKCGDVSNPSKPLHLYKQWVERVIEEFFQQGDMEKSRGLAITPFMDRECPRIPKSQIGFIEFICLPVYNIVSEQLSRHDIKENALRNLDYWKALNDVPSPPSTSSGTTAPAINAPTISISPPSTSTNNSSNNNNNNLLNSTGAAIPATKRIILESVKEENLSEVEDN